MNTNDILQCNKCNKTYKNKYLLLKHQTKTKKCINNDVIINKLYCVECKKEFLRKDSLQRHSKICKNVKKNDETITITKTEYDKLYSENERLTNEYIKLVSLSLTNILSLSKKFK
jgi:hypothetical protein